MREGFLRKPHLQALSQFGSASLVCLVLALWGAHSQLWFIFSVRNIPTAGAWGRNAPGSFGMNNWREDDPSSWRINKCMRQVPERINTASKVPGSSCAGTLFSQLGMKWQTQVQWGGAGCTVPSAPRKLKRLHCPAGDTSSGELNWLSQLHKAEPLFALTRGIAGIFKNT